MELEIERKWLIPIDKWELAKEQTAGQVWFTIEQGYISPEVRVRIITSPDSPTESWICVKQRETLLTVREFTRNTESSQVPV